MATHTYQCHLRWADMDVYGVINNVVFLRLLEEARVDFFARFQGGTNSLMQDGYIIVGHEIKYKRTLVHRQEPVPIEMWVSSLQGATTREIPDPNKLRLTCHVNGRAMQDANTSDMVFNVPYLIYYLSQCMVLEPGDLVSTGSPAGTALGRPDKPYLREGDVIEVEVCGLGAQRQICRNFRRDDA